MTITYRVIPGLLTGLIFTAAFLHAQEMPADYQQVLSTLNKKGDYKADVLKINIPRNDLQMVVD